jgi:Flp pilus assembly protein TadB
MFGVCKAAVGASSSLEKLFCYLLCSGLVVWLVICSVFLIHLVCLVVMCFLGFF